MKKLFLIAALFTLGAIDALAQTQCVRLRELDGSPDVNCVRQINVTNGTLTCSGNICTLTTGGGGGGGSPGGSPGQVQWNDASSFNGTSGLTATATTVTIVSGTTGVFSAASNLLTLTNTTNAASVPVMLLRGNRSGVASNDEAYVSYSLANSAAAQKEVARITWAIFPNTAASEGGRIDFSVMGSGSLAKVVQISPGDLSPSTNNVTALGTNGSLEWSDLYLGSGAVLGFDNNNVVLTHSTGILTMGTGELRITTPGTNAASVATLNAAQSFQSKTITNANNVLGSVTMDVTGTDADGDTYYRASNVLTRLPKGTAGQVLTMNAGATAPEWAAGGGGGTPADPTGTVGLSAVNGVLTTYMRSDAAPPLSQAIVPTWTGIHTFTNGVTTGTTSTSGSVFNYNALTTGTGHYIGSTSTAGSSTTTKLLHVAKSGAQSGSVTTTAATIENTSTGASATNVALRLTASGATTGNTALDITAGQSVFPTGSAALPTIVGIGTGGATGIYFPSGSSIGLSVSAVAQFALFGDLIRLKSSVVLGFSSGDPVGNANDVSIQRSAAGVIRLGNGSTGAGSLILGTSAGAIGTSGAGVLAFTLSTEPSTSPTDTVQLFSKDLSAGNAWLHLRNENDSTAQPVAVTSGTRTNGNCVKFDASGYLTDAGTTCGGSGSAGGSNTQVQYNNSSSLGGISGFTSDGTNVTAGSGNLRATLPQITTGIADANGNSSIALTATASAVYGLTLANAALLGTVAVGVTAPTQVASSVAGTPLSITAQAAVAGASNAGAAAGGSITFTAGAAARLTSGNANAGNYTFTDSAGIGTGLGSHLYFPAGTLAAPGLAFAAETDLGFSRVGTGFMSAVGGGNEFARFHNSALGGTVAMNIIAFGIGSNDGYLRRLGAGSYAWGTTAGAVPVAQSFTVQGGTGTNTNGATTTWISSLGTSQGVPGRFHVQTGGLIAASGTTAQTAVDRAIFGATKVLTNNSATTVANVTVASNTSAGGTLDYVVEVFDGTDLQYETGSIAFGVSNKAGAFSGNTATKFGNHQNATSGTLTVTWAISGANPGVLSVNANSSLTPSTGYPRVTYNVRSGSQQAIAVQ